MDRGSWGLFGNCELGLNLHFWWWTLERWVKKGGLGLGFGFFGGAGESFELGAGGVEGEEAVDDLVFEGLKALLFLFSVRVGVGRDFDVGPAVGGEYGLVEEFVLSDEGFNLWVGGVAWLGEHVVEGCEAYLAVFHDLRAHFV